MKLDRAAALRLKADLVSAAEEPFPTTKLFTLSDKGMRGMSAWLKALDPTVLDGTAFRRRDLCSRELLLLAIGHVAREHGAVLELDLPLTETRREAICRICLLDPAVLDHRIDQLLPIYPQFIAAGTQTGRYGRFLRFHNWPTLAALKLQAVM